MLLAVLHVSTVSAHGQTRPYNPYAPPEEFAGPIAPDGKLNWPPFFKSARLESKFQSYFQMGSCRGTKSSINNMLLENKVDVNELAETSLGGVVVNTASGIVHMRDVGNRSIAVITHPSGVSKIDVTGTMPPQHLHVGMWLRVKAEVDEHGVGLAPLSALEVVTPGADVESQAVVARHLQSIVGVITQLHAGDRLRLRVVPGKLHVLTFKATPSAVIHVNGHSLDLLAPGDEVLTQGHVYTGVGSLAAETIFASEVTVTKTYVPPAINSIESPLKAP